MTKTTESHNTGPGVPRRASTARRRKTLSQRVTDAARVVHRRRAAAHQPAREVADARWPSRQRLLSSYHAANLTSARRASEQLVRAGWHTGAVPYGYRPQRVRIAPHGRRSRYRTRLVIEPVEAAVVKMIFTWHVSERLSIPEIRQRLTKSRYPEPLDSDTGQPRPWTQALVQAIMRNPKYCGHQVWGRTHHGHTVPSHRWILSDTLAHPALIDDATFTAAQSLSAAPADPHGNAA
jgi:hypothetical protein